MLRTGGGLSVRLRAPLICGPTADGEGAGADFRGAGRLVGECVGHSGTAALDDAAAPSQSKPRRPVFRVWTDRMVASCHRNSPEAATLAARETKSDVALWGAVEEYGSHVIVTVKLVIPPKPTINDERRKWTVVEGNLKLELDLPSISYQFSPLIISNDVVAKYSAPDQIRVCKEKIAECDGARLGNPFRSIRVEGDYVLVRQANGAAGWVFLPDLSSAEGEVIDFTAALISYLRGDFEQAQTFFGRADSRPKAKCAAMQRCSPQSRSSDVERHRWPEAAHKQDPFSLFAVQALVMANIDTAGRPGPRDSRKARAKEASQLLELFRHLLAANDTWLRGADRVLRSFDLN